MDSFLFPSGLSAFMANGKSGSYVSVFEEFTDPSSDIRMDRSIRFWPGLQTLNRCLWCTTFALICPGGHESSAGPLLGDDDIAVSLSVIKNEGTNRTL
jgi:hypothetical protein